MTLASYSFSDQQRATLPQEWNVQPEYLGRNSAGLEQGGLGFLHLARLVVGPGQVLQHLQQRTQMGYELIHTGTWYRSKSFLRYRIISTLKKGLGLYHYRYRYRYRYYLTSERTFFLDKHIFLNNGSGTAINLQPGSGSEGEKFKTKKQKKCMKIVDNS